MRELIKEANNLMKQEIWEEIRKKDPAIPAAYIQAGIALRHLGRPKEALVLFGQSISLYLLSPAQAVNSLIQKAIILKCFAGNRERFTGYRIR